MSAAQRNKGAVAERELARLILDHLGVRMIRRLEQSRSGGCDLEVAPDQEGAVADFLRGCAIEIKRHRRALNGMRRKWWLQAAEQALASDRIPMLAYREDGQPWRFVTPWREEDEGYEFTVETGIECWAAFVREAALSVPVECLRPPGGEPGGPPPETH